VVVLQATRAWEGTTAFDDFCTDTLHHDCRVQPDDTAVIIYTSGTTGKSKGVMLTHHNIVTNVIGAVKAIHIASSDVFLSVLPLHHTFEATGGFLAPFCSGATITYAASLKSKDIIQDIRSTRVTIMVGVPLLYEKMLNGIYDAVKKKPYLTQTLFKTSLGLVRFSKSLLKMNLSRAVFAGLRKKGGLESLRLLACGGAPMAPAIQIGFEELGILFIQGYGTTEASPIITINPPGFSKPDAVGVPLEGVEVKIDQPNEQGTGEIVTRGPNIMKGYWQNPAATAEVLRDGWLHTGDMGFLDADGYLHITGRLKNMIVTGAGKNVYPEEIELELDKSPFILESLVVPQVDTVTRREYVHAIIVPDYEYLESSAAGQRLTLDDGKIDEIIGREVKQCCDNLADYKRVKDFQIREEEFDKTSTRKIKRYLYQQKSIELK
jgi:long-chain acyl-CoA synthetase